MANELLMALGLTVHDEGRRGEAASLKAALNTFRPSLAFSEIETNKATVDFDTYEHAEGVINHLYRYSEQTASRFNIILTTPKTTNSQLLLARAIAMLGSIEQRPTSSDYLVDVYITPEVYRGLLPSFQDLYRPPIQVGNNSVHHRFPNDAQRCFVVSPIGSTDTDIRNRADLVFEKYIKPACENTPFRPVRGDMMRGRQITTELKDALQGDPMVIVYLGSPKPGWNPNVMLELGLRGDAARVILKDATFDGQPYELPFDLKDDRVVEIPEHPKPDSDPGVEVRTIRERLLESGPTSWTYPCPVATVDLRIGGNDSKFIDAPKQLDTLFELKGIRGKPLNQVIDYLLTKMPACQRKPFVDEQNNLIARLIVNVGPRDVEAIRATTPIVFETHQRCVGQAILPIIIGYHFNTATNVLRLKIMYLDVTGVTKMNEGDEHYTCSLTGDEHTSLLTSQRACARGRNYAPAPVAENKAKIINISDR
jgi:hypothetical protein